MSEAETNQTMNDSLTDFLPESLMSKECSVHHVGNYVKLSCPECGEYSVQALCPSSNAIGAIKLKELISLSAHIMGCKTVLGAKNVWAAIRQAVRADQKLPPSGNM